MAKKRSYDERGVLALLGRKGCKIDMVSHVVVYPKDNGQIGIHTLGKLDFLQKKCGWIVKGQSTYQSGESQQDKIDKIRAKAEKIAKKQLKMQK